MDNRTRLVEPSLVHRDEYVEFYEDWLASGEDMVPWVIEKEPYDFEAMLDFLYAQNSEEKPIPEGWVPHSTYWLINEEQKLVGAVNIRHWLNGKLLSSGGHIGYGIRPSERGKGYAGAILAEALNITRQLGLSKVLVVCDQGNIGSEKTIVKHGGQLESEFIEDNGNVVRRFWIEL